MLKTYGSTTDHIGGSDAEIVDPHCLVIQWPISGHYTRAGVDTEPVFRVSSDDLKQKGRGAASLQVFDYGTGGFSFVQLRC